MPSLRRTFLTPAAIAATLVVLLLTVVTVFWISVGGTLRGERMTAATILQISLAVLTCVALGFLVPVPLSSSNKGLRTSGTGHAHISGYILSLTSRARGAHGSSSLHARKTSSTSLKRWCIG